MINFETDQRDPIFKSYYDTGFRSEALNNYKLKISNIYTGYENIIDISKRYSKDAFDKNGKILNDTDIFLDPFCQFIVDIDNNGIFEITYKQWVSLVGHSDVIGYTYTTLKWNNSINKFDIINVFFVPN